MADTQRDALERHRVREGLPQGGEWRFDLERDRWTYWVRQDGNVSSPLNFNEEKK